MIPEEERVKRLQRWHDFGAALSSASMVSIEQSHNEQLLKFDSYLRSREFEKTSLQEVAESTFSNIKRFRSFATLPIEIFNYGRRFQEVAMRESQNEPMPVPMAGPNFNQELWWRIEEAIREWIVGLREESTDIGVITDFGHVAGMAAFNKKNDGIEGFIGSVVIQAWTIFETGSEDIWVSALNFDPIHLAALSGKPRGRNKGSPSVAQATDPKMATFNDLQRWGFDVRSRMGTILQGSQSFRSLNGIREAYQRAFSEHFTTIDDILDSVMLRYAAAVRNLLVHKRGVVDKEFIDQTAGVPNLPALAIGHKFPLTGELCAKLTDACLACVLRLVVAVHQWLIAHPNKPQKAQAK